MEVIVILGAIIIVVTVIKYALRPTSSQHEIQETPLPYRYVRKPYIMTDSESRFYKRLQKVVGGKYLVFPQVHLSSLASNMTSGRYHKAGFQRINRRSVDYVLADAETLQAVYAVELDDRTHDTQKGRAIDELKTEILQQIDLPLVRFRNVHNMTDEDIIQSFKAAKEDSE